MNLKERVKNLIATPVAEWDVIAGEQDEPGTILRRYVLPLALLSAIASFIGYGLFIPKSNGFVTGGINWWGAYRALIVLADAFIRVYLLAWVIDLLAPHFHSEANFNRSFQVAAYAFTPVWVGGCLAVVPSIAGVGSFFKFYSIFLLYLGIPKLKGTPEAGRTSYFVVTLILFFIGIAAISYVLNFFITKLLAY